MHLFILLRVMTLSMKAIRAAHLYCCKNIRSEVNILVVDKPKKQFFMLTVQRGCHDVLVNLMHPLVSCHLLASSDIKKRLGWSAARNMFLMLFVV